MKRETERERDFGSLLSVIVELSAELLSCVVFDKNNKEEEEEVN